LPVEAGVPQAILFGGFNGDDDYYLNDTWSFDGQSWTKQKPPSSPSSRAGMAMTTFAGSVLSFGGTDANQVDHAELWSFGEGSWKDLDDGTVGAPPPRTLAGMATLDGSVVVFGGYQGPLTSAAGVDISLGDMWLWNGTIWSQLKPTTLPSARDSMMMATLEGSVVLFGGENSDDENDTALGDTWRWDGHDWTALHPAHSPSARTFAGMAPVQVNGKTVLLLFGGLDGGGNPFNDTWTWDGTDWTELHPAAKPDVRGACAMTSFNGGALVFGGIGEDGHDLSDTWLWSGSSWTQSSATGPVARLNSSLAAL
jgi:hypothetical protein